MRGRSIAVKWVLGAYILCVMPVSSFAEAICWIDHITKAEGGVNIYFIRSASLYVGGANTSRGTDGRNEDYVFVKDGSELYAFQSHHDTCSYSVSSDGAVGKVIAKAENHMPGLPAQSATQIISTDGTVSAPEHRRLAP
jgi:hypothetical protein